MKAESLKIYKVFSTGGDIHYVLPHFQRQYSWEKIEWDVMLNDLWAICEECKDDEIEPEHFLGSLVVINEGTVNNVIPAFNLVDGQQRLTTISLLLYALYSIIKETDIGTAKKIYKILVNADEEGDIHFKLLPTNKYGDRKSYQAIILGNISTLQNSESNIPKAYEYLHKALLHKINSKEINADLIFKVLSNCFQVVFIELNKDESPYKIFESLNAKGRKLSQADLVRNYIAMRLPPQKQEKIFSDYWEQIETLLQEKRTVGRSRIGELTAFLRHYLAMRSRVLCSEEHIYARFRDRFENEFSNINNFISELENLSQFAIYYDRLLRPEQEISKDIRIALKRLNTLDISTAYPFLLAAYHDFNTRKLTQEEFCQLLGILENYMVRRYIANSQTSYLNKMFPNLWKEIADQKEHEQVDFCQAAAQIIVNKNYPSDEEIYLSIQKTKLYNQYHQEKLVFVLETINRHLSKNTGGYTELDDKPSIEHILPQTPNEVWKKELGDNLEIIYHNYLHTLGNLTFVTAEWNSSLSNESFSYKKDKLCNHALKLNSDYFSQSISQWDEQAILTRAKFVADNFLQVWHSLGTPTVLQDSSGRRPLKFTIQNESFSIPEKTWRQFSKLIASWILKNHPEKFNLIRASLENYFSDDTSNERYPKDWYQLENGIWIYYSLSAKAHISLCTRMLKVIGINESDWAFELEE